LWVLMKKQLEQQHGHKPCAGTAKLCLLVTLAVSSMGSKPGLLLSRGQSRLEFAAASSGCVTKADHPVPQS